LGLQLGALLGGAVITETVFSWPGVGKLTVDAILRRDYPVVQASVLLISVSYVAVNVLTDLVYAWVDPRIREVVARSNALLMDPFDAFIGALEKELQTPSTHTVGRSHGMGNYASYKERIDAVNYALSHDDGATTDHYGSADVILVGVSRSGKTPTCLYLALQFGVHAANYPITEEDLDDSTLPKVLQPHRERLFGLTIDPRRLHQIRTERRPNSRYAEIRQCEREIHAVEAMYRRERIPFLDTSHMSVEEIGTTILHRIGRERRLRSG